MKLFLVLMVCAVATAIPKHDVVNLNSVDFRNVTPETSNLLVNALVRQLIAYVRRIINEGSDFFGIPPLDPLEMDHFHMHIPAGLINLELELKKSLVTGFGGFVVHKSDLNLRDLTFDIDVSIPTIDITCESYDLVGELFTVIPLYGKGTAMFKATDFRFQAKLFLMRSDNEQSVIIERIEGASFVIPSLKSELTGVIGGGDIDAIVNAMIEEVVFDYVNRFQGAIGAATSILLMRGLNPILEQLDTWRFIAPLLPRN